MKEFKCKETELKASITEGSEPEALHYGNLIELMFNTPIDREDQTYTNMKKAFNILDKFEKTKTNSIVQLDDVEVAQLEERAMKYSFPFRHKNVIEFVDYIKELNRTL